MKEIAMDDAPNNNRVTLNGIQWREVFPFMSLFRTFRLAVHPSKLILALVAVLACYVGGRFLDLLAGKRVVVEQPYYSLHAPADEIDKYIASPTMVEFFRWREQAKERNREFLASALTEYLSKQTPQQVQDLIKSGEAKDSLAAELIKMQEAALPVLDRNYKAAKDDLNKEYSQKKTAAKDDKDLVDQDKKKALAELDQANDYLHLAIWKSTRVAKLAIELNPVRALSTVVRSGVSASKDRDQIQRTIALADTYDRAQAFQGLGVFQAALSYGILMFNSAVDSVLGFELFFNPDFKSFSATPEAPPGLVRTLRLTIQGLGWFVRVHWLYFIVFSLFCLVVWAIAGGAICRIAAFHATRDEKIPLREAFGFAVRKFASFFTAPLMPVLFILGCCIPLLLMGVIGLIPVLGELIVGLSFVLLLLIGVVIAMIIIGAIGGLGLMYPTIAVEGSDTFDAFSRSYAYVYLRPWRTIFYTLVAAVYGTLCFVFVKLLVGLVFTASSSIVGATMNWRDAGYAAPLGKLQAMWYTPDLSGPFFGRLYLFKLTGPEAVGSFFIALWVFLLVGLVIAFAVSFFFSGYTVIYLLLRRVADATEFDEVYVEEVEGQLSGAVPTAVPAESSLPSAAEPAGTSAKPEENAVPESGPPAQPGSQ